MDLLTNIKYFSVKFLGIVLSLLLLVGCNGNNDAPDSPTSNSPNQGKVPNVTLNLKVAVLENEQADGKGKICSRAFDTDSDGTFEAPAWIFEKMSTLRVIIVRMGPGSINTIEHNRLVHLDPSTGAILDDENLKFQVISGENKRIYLFANEAAVDYDFSRLEPLRGFPDGQIANLLINRPENGAYIDNDNSDQRKYIPMSEYFDVNVPKPEVLTEDTEQKVSLFVTRSVIKFSFNISTDDDYIPNGLSIEGLKISGLADSGYYLPRNTIYNPAKGEASTLDLKGRYIVQFDVPPFATYSDYTFPFNLVSSDLIPGLNKDYTPAIYFPESKSAKDKEKESSYTISLLLDNEDVSYTPQPLQIKDIPRNTHVKVNIKIKNTSISMEVEVLPYTGVNLDPDFGL